MDGGIDLNVHSIHPVYNLRRFNCKVPVSVSVVTPQTSSIALQLLLYP